MKYLINSSLLNKYEYIDDLNNLKSEDILDISI